MRTIALRVEYDGTHFHGFQRQENASLPTVQGLLEQHLSEILDERVEVVGAGRTDAGVHAIGQVVHVRTHCVRPLPVVARALWRLASPRVAIPAAWEAPDWFHARHSAARRIYQYHLLCQEQPSPLLAARAWHVWRPVDVDIMRQEAATLLGRRDFKAFQAGGEAEHYFRTLIRFDLASGSRSPTSADEGDVHSYLRHAVERAPLLCLEIEADAFLSHMVRMMVGTLVDLGTGKRPAGTAARVLRGRDPRLSSALAPPQGLCLVRVLYPPACNAPQCI